MSKTIEELVAESKALGFEPPEEHRGVAMQEMQTSFSRPVAPAYVLGPLAGKRRCWSCAKLALETT